MESFLNASYSFFWFVVIISIVVFIHEFGHYFVARLNKVRVEVFSIGFGPEIFGWNDKAGTRWKVSIIPMGGYVKMFGDADASSTPDLKKLEKMTKEQKAVSFYFKSLKQKAAIVFAGPLFNYLSAILIMTFLFTIYGKPSTEPIISRVEPNSAAKAAGLKKGDRILKIEDRDIDSFEEIRQAIALNLGNPIKILIQSPNGHEHTTSLTPKIQKTKDIFGNIIELPIIGIASEHIRYTRLGAVSSFIVSIKEAYFMSEGMLKAIWQIITGARSTEQLGGPIKIAEYSGKTASQGIQSVLWFIVLISINLGLVNLLPIPMLDGGHLLYYGYEGLRGRPLSERVQMTGFKIGLVFLLGLMIYVTFNDIKSLFIR